MTETVCFYIVFYFYPEIRLYLILLRVDPGVKVAT